MSVRTCVEIRTVLGESALWHPGEQCLYWLDLKAPTIFRFDPKTGRNEAWKVDLPATLGCLVLAKDGSLILAGPKGLHRCDFAKRRLTHWFDPNDRPADTMFNDGKIDRRGRFWLGSSDVKETEPRGKIYLIEGEGHVSVADSGFACSNGPAFSPDGSVFYFSDTMERKVLAYNIDAATGNLKNRRVFATFAVADGMPDGLTVDEMGGLWVCHWGGARVTRFKPDGGTDRLIDVPALNVTSCAFGGPDLATLYITSASQDTSPEDLARLPLSGALFAVEPGERGLAERAFG
jgi:sugar lactone lactonase YvrE